MNAMTRALVIIAPLVVGAATSVRADVATTEVSYEIYDFYNPSQPLNDAIRVTAHNNATGVDFTPDQRGGNVFTLPVGSYTFSGRSQWCYLQQATIQITASTTDISLYAGCE